MKKFVIFVCGAMVVGAFFSTIKKRPFPTQGASIEETLSRIPKRDRTHLTYFFNLCVGWDEFGYVLFGDKPMAFSGYGHVGHPFESLSALRYAVSPRRIKCVNGYKAWKKYEKLFPMTQFLLTCEENENGVDLILVNKETFVQTVDTHQSDFAAVLKRPITGEQLLEEVHRIGFSNHPFFILKQLQKLVLGNAKAFGIYRS